MFLPKVIGKRYMAQVYEYNSMKNAFEVMHNFEMHASISYYQGFFSDSMRRYGVPVTFFQVKKKLFVMYIINE